MFFSIARVAVPIARGTSMHRLTHSFRHYLPHHISIRPAGSVSLGPPPPGHVHPSSIVDP